MYLDWKLWHGWETYFKAFFRGLKAAVGGLADAGVNVTRQQRVGPLNGRVGRRLSSAEGVSACQARADCLFRAQIKTSGVIAFKKPFPDEHHQFQLMVGRLGTLIAGAHPLYECPSGATLRLSAESPLMVQINGCKLSNHAISSFFSFCSEGQNHFISKPPDVWPHYGILSQWTAWLPPWVNLHLLIVSPDVGNYLKRDSVTHVKACL